ncbi:PPE family protein [Mycobacterium haemophilum]|uniref:PPE family protein n=1 Tax=Mycobacterium haemophilum TaxID=29311 RepID=A0A0I9UNK5_9MYCO|nr:PPE family protein [Mycobacterium haemophilum]KLO28160.1 hypothetical protein ABH39_14420 [Mycobacterium haemophilum]KLO37623.1 hypothetical protein ABH38_06440 [Mycobacterium haemophilum]KLO43295.1 hypothetical protein ABH37_08640 [Mycobacterium haemophilum]KLO48039.1 hypothetical protein ABH36_14960 [Mycobacterium haemophilum]
MLDFTALPPEINSTRMYAGAGVGALLAAVAEWSVLATELFTAAQGIQSVIEGLLAGPFLGLSALALGQAVTPYVIWLTTTATAAELTANQATLAADAYEAAYSMTVPPETVFANRVETAALVVTNLLGQNTPAIAEKQAEYAVMWVQDAAAMLGYQAGVVAAVLGTVPFEAAPEVVSDLGLAQGALVAQQALSPVAQATNQGITATSQLGTSQVSKPVEVASSQALSGPATTAAKPLWGGVAQHLSPMSNLVGMTNNGVSMLGQGVSQTNTLSSMMKGFMPTASKAAEGAAKAMQGVAESMGRGPLGSGVNVSGNLGRSASVGALRVPEAWATANQGVAQVRGLPLTSMAAAAEGGSGQMMNGLPMAPMGSNGSGGIGGVNTALRLQPKAFVMPRNLAGG